jgi:hypothetical protein
MFYGPDSRHDRLDWHSAPQLSAKSLKKGYLLARRLLVAAALARRRRFDLPVCEANPVPERILRVAMQLPIDRIREGTVTIA